MELLCNLLKPFLMAMCNTLYKVSKCIKMYLQSSKSGDQYTITKCPLHQGTLYLAFSIVYKIAYFAEVKVAYGEGSCPGNALPILSCRGKT